MINSNVLIKYIKCPYSELNKHKCKRGCSKWQQEELLSCVCQMSANWSFKVTKLKKKHDSTTFMDHNIRKTW